MPENVRWPEPSISQTASDASPSSGADAEGRGIAGTRSAPSPRQTPSFPDADAFLRANLEASLSDTFELLDVIGRGGMAVVFRARDKRDGQMVALKAVRVDLMQDEETLQRAEREARIARALEHPNIVRTVDVHRLQASGLVIAMELMAGGTLKSRLRQQGRLAVDDAVRFIHDIATALAYAHANGIVHRDLKPDNVFLSASDQRAKLGDFGIARLGTGHTLTVTGTVIGTPAFMSPEQIEGVHIDHRSDLYALGLVAWTMLSGAEPWAGDTLVSVIHKQRSEFLAPLSALRADVPESLQRCIEWCLRKDPDDRPESAEALLDALHGTRDAIPELRAQSSASDGIAPTIRFAATDSPTFDSDDEELRSSGHQRSTTLSPGGAAGAGSGRGAFIGASTLVLIAVVGALFWRRPTAAPVEPPRVFPAPSVAVTSMPTNPNSTQSLKVGAEVSVQSLDEPLRLPDGRALPLVQRDSIVLPDGSAIRLHVHGITCVSGCEYSDLLYPARLVLSQNGRQFPTTQVLNVVQAEKDNTPSEFMFSDARIRLVNGTPLFSYSTYSHSGAGSSSIYFDTKMFAITNDHRAVSVTAADPSDEELRIHQGLRSVQKVSNFLDTLRADGTFTRSYSLWRNEDPNYNPCGGRIKVEFELGLTGFEAKFFPKSYTTLEPENGPSCEKR